MIHVGDVFDVLPTLEAGSVRCCVTSPPYWGLRDYGTATSEGGDEACDHKAPDRQGDTGQRATRTTGHDDYFLSVCGKCGATRIDQQLGLEETPEQYVENMVRVFREVRRVLADNGTLWLNLGDSYWGGKGESGSSKARATAAERGFVQSAGTVQMSKRPQDGRHGTLKPKDLVGIPWRVAFALQADGWWLRSDIIWSKPNPMPESVTDRPTKAHEYVFLLSKSERYYYDHEAIAERADPSNWRTNPTKRSVPPGQHPQSKLDSRRGEIQFTSRNRRSVWTINTKAFPGAHFAAFPETLPSLCIQAGSAIGDTVLDPFAGAGTTGVVAQKLGREFVGIELNPEYADMARKRIAGTPLSLFAQEKDDNG